MFCKIDPLRMFDLNQKLPSICDLQKAKRMLFLYWILLIGTSAISVVSVYLIESNGLILATFPIELFPRWVVIVISMAILVKLILPLVNSLSNAKDNLSVVSPEQLIDIEKWCLTNSLLESYRKNVITIPRQLTVGEYRLMASYTEDVAKKIPHVTSL